MGSSLGYLSSVVSRILSISNAAAIQVGFHLYVFTPAPLVSKCVVGEEEGFSYYC